MRQQITCMLRFVGMEIITISQPILQETAFELKIRVTMQDAINKKA